MTHNMYLLAAVLVGLAAFAVVLIAPQLKPAAVACVVLAIVVVVWRWWGGRR